MNCQFCPEIEVVFKGFEGKCPRCLTKHSVSHMYVDLWYYGFSVLYKGSYYYFDFYCRDPDNEAGDRIFNLSKGRSPVLILQLDHFPNLTPFNALDKLPTLLTFQ